MTFPSEFRALRLHAAGGRLREERMALPEAGAGQVLLRVRACGVCRTDLHVVDGELTHPKLPLVPGHEAVGVVEACGSRDSRFPPGTRVGVPWLGWSCGECAYCRAGRENLCDKARFTGYDLDGGYAEWMLADERYCVPIPERYGDADAAPLLCAGLIGYRSYSFVREARTIGVYGYGAAAHIVAQVARHEGRRVFAFTRPDDAPGRAFALRTGAHWAGASGESPPEPLDAAIIFAPVGGLIPEALRRVRKGGTVVCGGIHMSPVPQFAYELLWGERSVRSVANLTRADGEAFMRIAAEVPLAIETHQYPLGLANQALDDLRAGAISGAAVLVP
jgi:propanol-preferring alcohol dehydrogenase